MWKFPGNCHHRYWGTGNNLLCYFVKFYWPVSHRCSRNIRWKDSVIIRLSLITSLSITNYNDCFPERFLPSTCLIYCWPHIFTVICIIFQYFFYQNTNFGHPWQVAYPNFDSLYIVSRKLQDIWCTTSEVGDCASCVNGFHY